MFWRASGRGAYAPCPTDAFDYAAQQVNRK